MSNTLRPLSASTLTTDSYRVLRDAILNVDLPPGTPLIEQQIANQLGISKTPVRSALARLAGEGLVVTEPGRKTCVAGLSRHTILELYQVRLLLEPAAIHQITDVLTDQDYAELQASIDGAADALMADDPFDFVKSNEEFHLLLIHKHGNSWLNDIFDNLFGHVFRVRAAIRRTEQEAHQCVMSERGLENHQRILGALIARDPELAAETMRADIQLFFEMAESSLMQSAFAHLHHRPGRAP